MGKQVAVLAYENLSKEMVDEILSDRDGMNPKWEGKPDHETVRWYQAAQALRSETNQKLKMQSQNSSMIPKMEMMVYYSNLKMHTSRY